MTTMQHQDLADGRWFRLSLALQLGNIGSEVSRVLKARAAGNEERMQSAFVRCLELFDLTLCDPRHRERLRELCRVREVLCDFVAGDNQYASTPQDLDRYFTCFAIAGRRGQ